MITHIFLVFVTFFLVNVVHSEEQILRTDNHPSALCTINRQGLGQLEHVELTASSISIRFQNVACSEININVFLTDTLTDALERTIENLQINTFTIDRLLPNRNYTITIQLSTGLDNRVLPSHIFQTLPSSDKNTLVLAKTDLLSIDQIQLYLLPHAYLYVVTLPSQTRRSTILGNITLSYNINQKQYHDYHLVKPLDNNVISRIGRMTSKTLIFSIELPHANDTSIDYSSSLQLFFSNDHRQSVVGYHRNIKYLPPITADFQSISSRSVRVSIRHLCLSYIEVKAIVYNNLKIVSRSQCDINKKENSLLDIANGRCSILLEKLQPEQNYTLSIRTTCPLTISSSSSYVFYDRARIFTFQTSGGLPDDSPLTLTFYNNNRTLAWTNQSANISYLGPDYYYELFTKSNDNWTLTYRGNQTQYQLPAKLIEKANLTFRLVLANRYGRQENSSSQIDINIDPIHHITSNNQIVVFTVLISVLLLILFGFLFLGCYLRHKKLYGKLKKKYYQNGDASDKELEHLRSLTHSSTLKDNILYTWNHTPTNVDLNKLPKIERNVIKLNRLIGKGAFGEVYAGTMMNNQSVAIKTLLRSASAAQRMDFLKEAIIMNQFAHEHIVRLLGVCFHNDSQPQFLLLELMEQGDLQNFLRRSRPTKDNDQCLLAYEDCIDIARQIADGACYLEQHSYVHRDLAARNCLVSSSEMTQGKILVKIGDFGLARMLSQQDYYRKTGEALLPVRWMAPESLLDALFTSQSDIWSFGIVLWEIITLGQVPYSPLNNQQVISLITTTRGTLEKPVQCTQTLYELMLSCWHYIPDNRISFPDIHSLLNGLLSDESKEQPSIWFTNETTSQTARNALDCVLNHIEPPTSTSFEGSDIGECRSSTSGCFSSMTESTSQTHPPSNRLVSSYQLRLIDDTTSNDFADDIDDDHSDIVVRSF